MNSSSCEAAATAGNRMARPASAQEIRRISKSSKTPKIAGTMPRRKADRHADSGGRHHLGGGTGDRFQTLAQLRERLRLELAHALLGQAEFAAEALEGAGLFLELALDDDHPLARAERRHRIR